MPQIIIVYITTKYIYKKENSFLKAKSKG